MAPGPAPGLLRVGGEAAASVQDPVYPAEDNAAVTDPVLLQVNNDAPDPDSTYTTLTFG